MSSTESIATPALPTSPDDARVVAVVAAVGREVEGDRQALLPGGEVRAGRTRSTPRRSRSPAYWRIVHGRLAYIVARTPRTNGVEAGQGADGLEPLEVLGGVERLDRDALGRLPDEAVGVVAAEVLGRERPPVLGSRACGHGIEGRGPNLSFAT